MHSLLSVARNSELSTLIHNVYNLFSSFHFILKYIYLIFFANASARALGRSLVRARMCVCVWSVLLPFRLFSSLKRHSMGAVSVCAYVKKIQSKEETGKKEISKLNHYFFFAARWMSQFRCQHNGNGDAYSEAGQRNAKYYWLRTIRWSCYVSILFLPFFGFSVSSKEKEENRKEQKKAARLLLVLPGCIRMYTKKYAEFI